MLVSTHINGIAYKSALVGKFHFGVGDGWIGCRYLCIVIAEHLLLIVSIRTSVEQEERRTQRIVLCCGIGEVRSVHGIGISRTVNYSFGHLAVSIMIGKRLVVACQCSAFYASNVRFEHSAFVINAAFLYLGSSVGKLRQVFHVVLVLPRNRVEDASIIKRSCAKLSCCRTRSDSRTEVFSKRCVYNRSLASSDKRCIVAHLSGFSGFVLDVALARIACKHRIIYKHLALILSHKHSASYILTESAVAYCERALGIVNLRTQSSTVVVGECQSLDCYGLVLRHYVEQTASL